jgi:hypothetical protein
MPHQQATLNNQHRARRRTRDRIRHRSVTPAAPKVRVSSLKEIHPEILNLLYKEASPGVQHFFEKVEDFTPCKREYVSSLRGHRAYTVCF